MPLKKSTPSISVQNISRRTFLGLSGGAALYYFTRGWPPTAAAADRLAQWEPDTVDSVEWRYVAGRITDGDEDYGFVVSLSTLRILGSLEYQLLVQRKSFNEDSTFAEKVYENGTLTYDSATATYTFEIGQAPNTETLATWQWDETEGVYRLTVNTTELTLTDIVLRPQGSLIAEGGDGDIRVGRVNGVLVGSDYHADWTTIEIGDVEKGVARLDMQGLRPIFTDTAEDQEYAHHWFAIAATLESGQKVWVSAWRIEHFDSPFWVVTIASGSGQSWQIEQAVSEESGVDPLQVEVLAWQPVPFATDSRITGSRWRVVASNGVTNILDVEIGVPPGQFIEGKPISGIGGPSQMQEAIGTDVSGTILGEPISSVSLVVAESTADVAGTLIFLPLVTK